MAQEALQSSGEMPWERLLSSHVCLQNNKRNHWKEDRSCSRLVCLSRIQKTEKVSLLTSMHFGHRCRFSLSSRLSHSIANLIFPVYSLLSISWFDQTKPLEATNWEQKVRPAKRYTKFSFKIGLSNQLALFWWASARVIKIWANRRPGGFAGLSVKFNLISGFVSFRIRFAPEICAEGNGRLHRLFYYRQQRVGEHEFAEIRWKVPTFFL